MSNVPVLLLAMVQVLAALAVKPAVTFSVPPPKVIVLVELARPRPASPLMRRVPSLMLTPPM